MELRHLRVFTVLAEELHFGRTARRLHVAQSAVSHTIAALEEEVGTPLLSRASRRVGLTPAGAEFLLFARRGLEQVVEGVEAARRVSAGADGHLSICFGPLCCLSVLPTVVATFQREFPRVRVSLRCASPDEQFAAIRQGRADVGFVALAKHDEGALVTEPVTSASVVAVLPRKHRLARRTFVSFRELSGSRLFVLDDGTNQRTRRLLEERFRAERFQPSEVHAVAELEALLAFVAAGIGVSFLPAFISGFMRSGIVLVPVRPRLVAGIVSVHDGERITPTAALFLKLLRETISTRTPAHSAKR